MRRHADKLQAIKITSQDSIGDVFIELWNQFAFKIIRTQEPVQVSDIYSSPLLFHVILLLKVKVLILENVNVVTLYKVDCL
jgi:hypothetical protein